MKKNDETVAESRSRNGASCDVDSLEDDHVRCACGSLLARFVDGQIELKCRRCKRTVMLAIENTPHGVSY